MSEELQYSGINFFRQRLVYSLLSGRSVKIFDIRHKDENPGVKGNTKISYFNKFFLPL